MREPDSFDIFLAVNLKDYALALTPAIILGMAGTDRAKATRLFDLAELLCECEVERQGRNPASASHTRDAWEALKRRREERRELNRVTRECLISGENPPLAAFSGDPD